MSDAELFWTLWDVPPGREKLPRLVRVGGTSFVPVGRSPDGATWEVAGDGPLALLPAADALAAALRLRAA